MLNIGDIDIEMKFSHEGSNITLLYYTTELYFMKGFEKAKSLSPSLAKVINLMLIQGAHEIFT